MATVNPLPCHRCGDTPTVDYFGPYGYNVYCDNCYDGAPDGNHEVTSHPTRNRAIDEWNGAEWRDE